jgi:hypothetical protein
VGSNLPPEQMTAHDGAAAGLPLGEAYSVRVRAGDGEEFELGTIYPDAKVEFGSDGLVHARVDWAGFADAFRQIADEIENLAA